MQFEKRLLLALGLILIGMLQPVKANYSPLNVGNEWVYKGAGRGDPAQETLPGSYLTRIYEFKEELKLKVTSVVRRQDTITSVVLERDSLYNRRIGFPYSVNDQLLPDTVLVHKLEYKMIVKSGKIQLTKGSFIGNGHADTADLFFYSSSTAPFFSKAIANLPVGFRGIETFGSNSPYESHQAWYLDGVGLYWAKLNMFCWCGCAANRELLLTSFNHVSIDPGINPPGLGLAKGTRFTCKLKKSVHPSDFSMLMRGKVMSMNLLGQSMPRK